MVNIDYTVRNGVRYFDDYDEFYWNVTGNDWPVPIDHASAFVTCRRKARRALRAQAFTGAYGSRQARRQCPGEWRRRYLRDRAIRFPCAAG